MRISPPHSTIAVDRVRRILFEAKVAGSQRPPVRRGDFIQTLLEIEYRIEGYGIRQFRTDKCHLLVAAVEDRPICRCGQDLDQLQERHRISIVVVDEHAIKAGRIDGEAARHEGTYVSRIAFIGQMGAAERVAAVDEGQGFGDLCRRDPRERRLFLVRHDTMLHYVNGLGVGQIDGVVGFFDRLAHLVRELSQSFRIRAIQLGKHG